MTLHLEGQLLNLPHRSAELKDIILRKTKGLLQMRTAYEKTDTDWLLSPQQSKREVGSSGSSDSQRCERGEVSCGFSTIFRKGLH
ncbi:hypothetical protein Y1Q_0010895 [Alligator mississippiensis]|uniref:Uncharacterized protein n=1 Tax=Alligator mississippiensis TaxID=8496 RepID=A0A151M7G7_ALLMI|nr:hypothetical protein Y1Q_0010895 [Alligator mississippiensis]